MALQGTPVTQRQQHTHCLLSSTFPDEFIGKMENVSVVDYHAHGWYGWFSC